ncbi:hypothetical protein GCM10028778_24240 [Barrientosiimonas marina]|uniref:DUF3784 domain-containing protein n=1 Tax=Lentibacillus kimchii TaxID=1542911 RepID=A0ABW2UUC4_9BACI
MLVLFSFILVMIAVLFFLMGYAYLNDKAENIVMWSFTGKLEKEVTDKEGFKKYSGKHSIVLGLIFLAIPVSLFIINRFDLNRELLYLWFFVFAGDVILNSIKERKFFK